MGILVTMPNQNGAASLKCDKGWTFSYVFHHISYFRYRLSWLGSWYNGSWCLLYFGRRYFHSLAMNAILLWGWVHLSIWLIMLLNNICRKRPYILSVRQMQQISFSFAALANSPSAYFSKKWTSAILPTCLFFNNTLTGKRDVHWLYHNYSICAQTCSVHFLYAI